MGDRAERPRIVVLDSYTLNPGDLSWGPLEALGDCVYHDRTPVGLVVERSGGAQILLTNKTVIGAGALARLPDLRYIGVLATGYNIVDAAAARARGIPVTNVPGYATDSVAQTVFAHLLNLCLRVADHSRSVHAGRWSAGPDFCFWEHPLIELRGMTMGIVGFGQTGRAVAALARAFGMRVQVHTRTPGRDASVEFVSFETLLATSDVVSLHCPLTAETERIIDARALARMKPSAFLINTGRGPLVDEAALASALRGGHLAGAGLDVLSREPPPRDHPLLGISNCHITPHTAWATLAARRRLLEAAAENIACFLSGQPRNVVNRT